MSQITYLIAGQTKTSLENVNNKLANYAEQLTQHGYFLNEKIYDLVDSLQVLNVDLNYKKEVLTNCNLLVNHISDLSTSLFKEIATINEQIEWQNAIINDNDKKD